ncbi:hypothetical protein RQ359_000955 [Sulfuracidifex metallicus DSM 6482 = JCM 9184]|nr:hypothetical protein RQ359_000955 [Sulfuracidifex metallicus DSM 6482 = JCM 9184]
MKRTIFFSLFLLVFVLVGVMGITNATASTVPIKTPGLGGGGNPGYFKYTEQINLTQTTTETTSTSYPGEDLDSLSWLCPGYVSVTGTELQILSATEYTQNNASFSISSSATSINVTFTNGGNGGADSKYGGIGIGYGGYIPANPIGAWGPSVPDQYGIVVYLEQGGMTSYHLFVYFDGSLCLNATVGSLPSNVGLGFYYVYPTLFVYYYNGTWHRYSITPVEIVGTSVKDKPLDTLNSNYFIDAQDAGPGYGYAQWIIASYSYYTTQTIPGVTADISWMALSLSNGVKALVSFTGAGNPVNVSTSATWTIQGLTVKNYSVTGNLYPTSGSFSYVGRGNSGIFVYANAMPSQNLDSWYVNVTFTFQFVTSTQTVEKNITIPVFVDTYAEQVCFLPPNSQYLSGQTISVTNSTLINYPSGWGYVVLSPARIDIEVQGLTSGYVPLPYSISQEVQQPTTYPYTIIVTEDGFVISSFTSQFTVYPVTQQPVMFVEGIPGSGVVGQTLHIQFQFTDAAPIANLTKLPQSTGDLQFSFWKIEGNKVLLEFSVSNAAPNGGLAFIQKEGPNILIPFNGSAGILLNESGVNEVQFSVLSSGLAALTEGQVTIYLGNWSPVIGVGLYLPSGTMSWFFVDGAILQNAMGNQAFVVLTGVNPTTLTQVESGYTNASGWGSATVSLTDVPYQLIDVDWYGVTYSIFNITVNNVSTPITTTTVSTTNTSYNYSQPFHNTISPNSSLYNFSAYQPWATLIGIAIVVLISLLSWKFAGYAGASAGAVMGLIAASYLGLFPWYVFYVFIFGIAMLIAKTIVDKFMGGDE